MKRILLSFLTIFALVSGSFFLMACQSPNFLWCTSSGIVTYNRHTGQFEMLWESDRKQVNIVHDTIYIQVDSVFTKP